MRLIWTQGLHWAAVLAAINLMYVADVGQMMNADARALAMLTLLALGTFTAGVHVAAWRICLVGVLLALSVPAIAWFEQRTLLLLLAAGAVLVAARESNQQRCAARLALNITTVARPKASVHSWQALRPRRGWRHRTSFPNTGVGKNA